MNAKTEQKTSAFDKAKLLLAGAVVVGSIAAYYYYAEYSQLYRVAGVIAAAALAIAIGMQSEPGRNLWSFAQTSRIELRKVIWPSRQETMQRTLAVIVFVIVMGVFFWALDWVLLWATKTLTGRGGS